MWRNLNSAHNMNQIHISSNPGSQRRQRRREEKTAQLLDAAVAIASAGGLAALTVGAVAERSEVAVGSIYRYFPNKDALIVAVQAYAIEAFGQFLAAKLAQPEERPLARVVRAFGAYAAYAKHAPDRYQLMDGLLSAPQPSLSDGDAAQVQAVLDPILARCAATLDAAVAGGWLAPGDALVRTHVAWAALHGVGHFRKRDGRVPRALHSDALANELLTALLVGWGGGAAPVREALAL